MAIATKRFEFLDKETQVGSANFSKLLGSSIQNIDQNAFKTISSSLTTLLGTSLQLPSLPVTDLLSSFKSIERIAKDSIGSIVDFSKMSSDELGSFTSLISKGKYDVSKSLGEILTSCSTGGGGLGYGGRPYLPSVGCGNGRFGVNYGGYGNNCSAANFSDLLGKMGANSTLRTFQDIAKALTALLSLSKKGYNLGLCGVFGSLVNSSRFTELGLNNTEYSKAAGILLNTLGVGQDSRGWIDVAAVSVTNNYSPLLTNPGAVTDLFNHYKLPAGISEHGLAATATATFETVASLNELWQSSRLESTLSLGDYVPTDDLKSLAEVKLNDRAYSALDLDVAPSTDDDFFLAALAI